VLQSNVERVPDRGFGDGLEEPWFLNIKILEEATQGCNLHEARSKVLLTYFPQVGVGVPEAELGDVQNKRPFFADARPEVWMVDLGAKGA